MQHKMRVKPPPEVPLT